ncbi:hypothetical protein ACQ4PT_014662 [Festuca glaucescens]
MKLLEYTPFDSVNVFFDQLNLGDCTIRGNLEAFSCKHAGNDRRLSISLEHDLTFFMFRFYFSRKTLIYLALTLGHMYPDYDFSAVRAHLFFREEDMESFKQMLDNYLSEACMLWAAKNEGSSLLDSMTKAIDEVIKIRECDIYSYNPDSDGDPFLEKGAIWSINFFFYNRKLKRVVSFRCCCTSKFAGDDFLAGVLSEGEEDALIDMDI